MKNLKEPCQKSADKLLSILDDSPEFSPSLTDTIDEGENLLVLASYHVPDFIIKHIEDKAKGKKIKIIRTPSNSDNINDYDFFGVTAAKTPILINKAFLKSDTVILISPVTYDGIYGFSGGKNLIFPGITHNKTVISAYKTALDEKVLYKNKNCDFGVTKDNPAHMEAVNAVMITRQNVRFFGINLIPDNDGSIYSITCGDLFLSHISASEIFKKKYPLHDDEPFDGVNLRIDTENLEEGCNMIEESAANLKKSGKLLIKGDFLKSFGSEEFRNALLSTKTYEDIFNETLSVFSIAKYRAMIFKRIIKDYEVAINGLALGSDIAKSGVSIFNDEDESLFFAGCTRIGEIYDTGGFTARR